tara:strand:+ start:1101 stop:2045 length:945 start_codon:yes stop_codon:yes gene_type:complete
MIIKNLYRKLQYLFVPYKIKNNFLKLTQQNKDLLSQKIKDLYLPTISKNISNETLLSEVNEHVDERVLIDRVRVVPWIVKNLDLDSTQILEIGCGTGSSSITLAEQGANVLGIDIHRESLEIARLRAEFYNLDIEYLEFSAVEIDKLEKKFDAVILYATLEHLTLEERLITLGKCKSVLNKGGYLIVIEAPNRLWYFDSHTAELPFFQWLPDDLAYKYSRFSPKKSFSENYLDKNYKNFESFLRRGRGVSYHEFQLVFGDLSNLTIVSRLNRLVFTQGYFNTFIIKPLYKKFLKKQIIVPNAFYDEYLDFIIKF